MSWFAEQRRLVTVDDVVERVVGRVDEPTPSLSLQPTRTEPITDVRNTGSGRICVTTQWSHLCDTISRRTFVTQSMVALV